MDTNYLPSTIECIPSLTGVAFTPAVVSLGEDLGQRASLSITFKDHRWPDIGPGYDPYINERPYVANNQGTYWGKFKARHPFLRGKSLRLIRGTLGQNIEDMDTRHYVIESVDGPSVDGTFTIIAKDVLKLADGDRAQCPAISNGRVLAALTTTSTTLILTPSGIGNAEYPASGLVAVGGKEICSYTRSGDTLTIGRARNNTVAQDHPADSRVQLVKQYTGQDPAVIIRDLLVTYAGIPSSYIPLSSWQSETAAYLRRVYTAVIAEPTSVATLISEIIQQAALAIWWDDKNKLIQLQVLRPIPSSANTFSQDEILQGSTSVVEQPNKRISQVWTYYAQINPLRPMTDEDNFRSIRATVDLQAESDYGSAAIKKIFSRWIPAFGGSVATRLNDLQLGRYVNPPRMVQFELFNGSDASLGVGYQFKSWCLQDDTGADEIVPVQITRLDPQSEKLKIEAEESIFTNYNTEDPNSRVIVIDSNAFNINLRTIHDTLYPVITNPTGITVTAIITAGVTVGSMSAGVPALHVGTWVAGLDITIYNYGKIQGCGGDGGDWGQDTAPVRNPTAGGAGGTALYTRVPVKIDDTSSTSAIWGGGGGGGGGKANQSGSGGGGGAGTIGGNPGLEGTTGNHTLPKAGTSSAGGAGGYWGIDQLGGNGGGPGLAGSAGDYYSTPGGGGAGGAAGKSIDGIAFVTNIGTPTSRKGPQV